MPFHALPLIHRPWRTWNEHWNVVGQFLIRIAAKAHFRGTGLRAQVPLLEVHRPNCFREENVDGNARIGFSNDFRQVLLNRAIVRQVRVAEFDARNPRRIGRNRELLKRALAQRIHHHGVFHARRVPCSARNALTEFAALSTTVPATGSVPL